jgi:formylglycine-generating enzyme required for sulfatase activity
MLDDVDIPLACSLMHAPSLVGWAGDLPHHEIDRFLREVASFLSEKEQPALPLTQGPKAGETRTNPADGLTYVWIPPGTFTMGCSTGDTECRDNEKPPRMMKIANGFWLGQTLVMQAAWKKVMKGNNPSEFKGDRLPVEKVSWDEANEYCRAIGGRLPSEEEWEYASRAGVTDARYGHIDAIAWHKRNSGGTTHPVGLKQANGWGLYDTMGNVWEWTGSAYDDNTKVLRGGSWYDDTKVARVSGRYGDEPADRDDSIGFRCVWMP